MKFYIEAISGGYGVFDKVDQRIRSSFKTFEEAEQSRVMLGRIQGLLDNIAGSNFIK